MQNLLGIVLCGGESKRMGSDKGLLTVEGTIWAKYIADKLSPFNIPVLFSVNELQIPEYSKHIGADKLIVDDVDVPGPLRGLLSVHEHYQTNNLLLLACDMLDMDEFTIATLIKEYQKGSDHDFIVYQDEDYAQPFCGIYKAHGLKTVLEKAELHMIHKFSLQKVLNEGNTKRLPIDNLTAFKNYNNSHI
ncbi:molybdenum cofactor guanylyltransferase [Ferruginibacter sp. SUN002]|uniref:molybdenum cofactor guanylyltransferase n=1 Tax=Ferruginibacter sp. SUN002 TaxID=2937789 RepID=UPI003D36F9F5